MKPVLLAIVLFISNVCIGQIPNNSFENWSDMNGYSTPDGWGNLNPKTYLDNIFTCLQGNANNPGTIYLYLITKNIPGKGIIPGKVVSGKIDTITFEPISGFPFTERPLQLNYDFQYMPYDPTDSVNVSVLLSYWNNGISKRDTIAYGANYYNAMAHEWIPASTYLNYVSNANPDSAIIVISSSSKAPKEGSYIYIDNLQFDGTANGIGEQTLPNCNIYPNPTSSILNIDIADYLPCTATIFNSLGLQIYSRQSMGSFQIETSTFHQGLYFLQLRSGNNILTKKIIKS